LLTSSSAWADPDPATKSLAPTTSPASVSAPGAPPPAAPPPAAPPAAAPAPAGSGEKSEDPAVAANAAYQRGNLLDERGELVEALAAFERAYKLMPAYQVLYNIGGVNLKLGRLASARRAYAQYLELGGPALSPERTATVHRYLEELSQKTATLTLQLNVPALVHVDGVQFESTQVTGLILEPGDHVLRVTKPGFEPLEKVLRTTDGENLHLVLPLERLSAEPGLPGQGPFGATPAPRVEVVMSDAADERVSLWIPWTITGALAAGWLTTAGLAIKARHDRNIIERPETSAERIDAARRLHETLAVVSDVLLVSTLASAGVSAYLTWWPRADPAQTPGGARGAANGLSVGVFGRF
jgi:PEGA domain